MKKLVLSLFTLAVVVSGANAQAIVNIPDANFKAYLVGNSSINTNSDTEIQVSEATAFSGQISCNNQGIDDMTGIEAFVSLTDLRCEHNDLNTLDLSQNTDLTILWCGSNNLNTLDLSQNTDLSILGCGGQNITGLNLDQNTALTYLECFGNAINSLDLSNNINLTYIDVFNNNLNALDVSQCTGITDLYCQSNDLAVLNMKNISTSVLTGFNATSNPNLTCIEVDDVAAATSAWTNIDATAGFSLDCNYTVYIPDPIFKAYLVGNSSINSNSDSEIQVSEAAAATYINCDGLGISDMTGIEAFTSLSVLACGNNSFSSIDVSAITTLFGLNLENNMDISSIDISANVNLASINVSGCNISTLDFSNNPVFESIFCSNTPITELDFSQHPNMVEIVCMNNSSLESLNLQNVSTGAFLNATNNPNLTCIEVDDVAAATAAWTNIDATASFSLNCGILVSSIDVTGEFGATAITTSGGTLQMEAAVLPANADDATYTWSVTNGTGSASIDANGLLTALTDGTVTVTATANDGSGVTGDAVITISNQGVGINEAAAAINLRAYPNPASELLNVEADEAIESISIIDITGKTVRTFSGANNRIDVSTLDSGVYLLQVQTAKGIATKRLIKE